MKDIKFNDYVNMIRKWAHYYSRRYLMDYQDLESQGFEIYCQAIKNYHKKASFSTFLYINLKGRLKDYCNSKVKLEEREFECSLEDEFNKELVEKLGFDILSAREKEPNAEQFLEFAKCYLSNGAYKIIKWLLSDPLSKLEDSPSFDAVREALNLRSSLVLLYFWDELCDFWKNKGKVFYSEFEGGRI